MSSQPINKPSSFKKDSCNAVLNDITVSLPFPPNFNVAADIINRRKPSQINLKAPNAFLIYRKVFLDHICTINHNLKMTDVSKLVSTHWKNEPESVKSFYKEVSQQIECELNKRRKANVSFCRVVWKNSKLSGLSNQRRKATKKKRQFNFSAKTSSRHPSRSNIFYEFVNVTPEAILASKPGMLKTDNFDDFSLSTSATNCKFSNTMPTKDKSHVIGYNKNNNHFPYSRDNGIHSAEASNTNSEIVGIEGNIPSPTNYNNNNLGDTLYHEEFMQYAFTQNLDFSQSILNFNYDILDYYLHDFSD
ncbi:4364_t:CDS:1 [Cetraspora pellucida]|uniref:4364_t:CDS:1 n=1 Tax=Cetraspora pellucida TaxID=1433469 RepID=A0ACA9K7L0_9GLOM|nr:4364_t:CDS:1 [Cetraspora pellucida]